VRRDAPHRGEEINHGEVTPARPAASVIMLRDSADGPEVLLVQRNPEARFMPSAWVFPGGAVHDPETPAETALRELEEEAGVRIEDVEGLATFSRWITPAQVTTRFDTWFFVAAAPDAVDPVVDGSECVDWRWTRPQAALDDYEADRLELVFPTIKHLEQLTEFPSVQAALEAARARKVLPVEPRVLLEGGIARVVLPGEPGYEEPW
jgi:8-oxo-dGTP pyrophosphatase MutT (NUDIX family)